MIRRPPRSTRTDTLFPYTTLFRSLHGAAVHQRHLPDPVMARRIVGVALRLLAGIALLGGGYHYGARQTVANMAAPSPVDVGFAQFMRGHHDQAVVMTQILLGRGTTRLVGLARSIQKIGRAHV